VGGRLIERAQVAASEISEDFDQPSLASEHISSSLPRLERA